MDGIGNADDTADEGKMGRLARAFGRSGVQPCSLGFLYISERPCRGLFLACFGSF